MTNATRFLRAFVGSDIAHGQTTVGAPGRNGKVQAKSIVIRETLTEEKVLRHLRGEQGMGAIPINTDNKVMFGVIDVDVYDLDHAKLLRRMKELRLPLTMCRSKSGGAHIFLFLDDWFDAGLVREYLVEMAAALGHSGCEVFPKQDKILVDRGDVGNFINLPYFNSDSTLRYAFNENCEALTLDEFLDTVESTRIPLSVLEFIDYGAGREDLKDYPPCMERMFAAGSLSEMRNITMFNFTVAAKKERPDEWKQRLEEANVRYCDPPLPANEIALIQKQHEKKVYGFQCNNEPLRSFCDKALCRTRKFGIGSAASIDMPSLSGMSILMSDPRLYFLDVNGQRIELTLEQLQQPRLFQRECMRQLSMMPPAPKEADWTVMVNNLFAEAVQMEVPPELTFEGQLTDLLQEFCTSNIRAMAVEEVVIGKPWTAEGRTYFKIAGLEEFLRQRNFTQYTRPQLQEHLKKMNGGQKPTHHLWLKKSDGTRTTVRVWWVREFLETEVDIEVQDGQGEIPF